MVQVEFDYHEKKFALTLLAVASKIIVSRTMYDTWCNEQEKPSDSATIHYGLARCLLARGDIDRFTMRTQWKSSLRAVPNK